LLRVQENFRIKRKAREMNTWALSWRKFVRRTLAATLPSHWFFDRAPAASGSVCLTFDDGPHPEHTPRLLDVLKDHLVPATFFVIGNQAARYPDLVRRIFAEGHAVGHHSFHHSADRTQSAAEFMDEVYRTRDLLAQLLGEAPQLFRPPYGLLSLGKLWRLWRARQSVVLWNVDPRDYACHSAQEIRDWFSYHPLQAGDVVLMHDDSPYPAQALPDIIRTALDAGIRFSKVSDWV
jgi:peptidoglycan/xylan/chitin deacetylase (PgdA/CDA1 family)